jgi:tRNA-dihydrouridine synthase B
MFMSFSWSAADKPIVVLSPMAGVTDSAYRHLVKTVAPETIVVTEFLSADAIAYASKKTLAMLKFVAAEQPLIVQVFGKRLENFITAGKMIEDMGVAGIDINMGCPAKKVIHADHGSALTKIENCALAFKIVEEMSKAVKIPISVKTRLGFENDENLIPFCKSLVESGAKSIAIHGRTTKQGYKGLADWKPIYALKDAFADTGVPVLGNGDVLDVSTYSERIGNLDGVLIGRGSYGNPWIFREIIDGVRPRITWGDIMDTALLHAKLIVEDKGEKRGLLEMRKFLAYYIKGFDGAKGVRKALVRVETVRDVEHILGSVDIERDALETQLKRDSLDSRTWQ